MTDQPAPLRVEMAGGVAVLTLDRPECGNAIDGAMALALLDAAARCESDAAVRCVVLTGAGKLFCGGGDAAAFAGAGQNVREVVSRQAGIYHAAIARLAAMSKPLITAVNGPAAGAGLGLAIMGDIALASDSAHFTFGYTAIGMTPDGGTSWFLPRLIGMRRAQEMAMTNRRVAAAEAAAMGLVTRVVPADALVEEAMTQASVLARGATAALGLTRNLLWSGFQTDLVAQLHREGAGLAEAAAGPEGREGIQAFIERRSPRFPS